MARLSWIAPAAAALFLCGCSIIDHEPYRATAYFDITPSVGDRIPDAKVSAVTVSPALQFSDRMLVRVGSDEMKFDEYSRWLANPEVLIRRYFESIYATVPAAPALHARVLRFELDKQAQTATCELQVELLLPNGAAGSERTFKAEATVKAAGPNASDFAVAMNNAVDQISSQIAGELKKMK